MLYVACVMLCVLCCVCYVACAIFARTMFARELHLSVEMNKLKPFTQGFIINIYKFVLH